MMAYQRLAGSAVALTQQELATIPEDTSNRFALAIGYYIQRIYILIPVVIVLVLTTLTGIIHFITKGTVPPDVVGATDIIAGVIAGLFLWLVWNSPYDMLKKLRETIIDMMHNNKQAVVENAKFHQSNTLLANQLATMRTDLAMTTTRLETFEQENTRHRMLNETLEAQLKANQVFVVGQQQIITRLSTSVTDQTNALGKVMQTLRDHVTADVTSLNDTVNSFYATLSGLDDVTKRNEALSAHLAETVDRIDELLAELRNDVIHRRLEKIIAHLNEVAPSSTLKSLLLHNVKISAEMGKLLDEIDNLRSDQLAPATKSRDIDDTVVGRAIKTARQARELITF